MTARVREEAMQGQKSAWISVSGNNGFTSTQICVGKYGGITKYCAYKTCSVFRRCKSHNSYYHHKCIRV